MKLLIIGCGYSGQAIARTAKGVFSEISGTTRSAEKAEKLREAGIGAFIYDGGEPSGELAAAMAEATHIIQSIAPGEGGDPLLNLGIERLRALCPALTWIGYLSTVGVYGDHDGAWVTEETVCKPVSRRSVERVDAENGWQEFAEKTGVPVAILRLSGIYGPGRNTFKNLEKGTARRLIKDGQVFNRIRVEDIATAALFLAQRNEGGIFNVTDDEPAPPQDVVEFAARLIGAPVPPDVPFETADLKPMARSFYGENKRVSNAKIKSLGFEFAYPNYRQSLQSLLENGWQ
ncbi:SDR family oxidoreductase [Rhizobium sp. L1K21]|uniref:SDR family oxidoreductase n=1 Tax=Rhizobium sp. L1K21 TaxID=2954933 RepID=UPI0020921948|nr:SDR family oxidoreductase [Rhizobium sp. L1K21]MCO6187331.1 SDR family oxidoreductase [Rhizobium sp. L1K21]